MPRQRKTDKWRLREMRGQGMGQNYKPWIFVHEVSSDGRSHKLLGWKHNRVYHLLSDGELWAFLRYQMEDTVIDIREQFPLLPLDETLEIAEELGISHPPKYRSDIKDKAVLTSDFNLLIKDDSGVKEIVRTLKTEEDYSEPRTQEKLFIEKIYWKRRGIDWGVILHSDQSKVIGRNIYSIYQDYFWNDNMEFNTEELEWLIYKFKDKLIQCNMEILKTTRIFEKSMEWQDGEGLNFFKYLLANKVVKADFSIKFNCADMKVWF